MKEIFTFLIAVGVGYYFLILAATIVKLIIGRINRPLQRESDGFELPPVSILKPLRGLDGNLRGNLLSFINQDYPQFEIMFGVQSPDDPAVSLIKELIEEYPDKDLQLVVADKTPGYNPKVNNLFGMMPCARYDHMLISDSNVMVRSDYLRANMEYFRDERTGLVTNLIRGVDGENFGAIFENLHLNSFIIGNVSLLSLACREIVVGKSIFFRRSQLDTLGGIMGLRNYLAEDYLMGRMYRGAGYRVVVAPYVISTTNDSWTFRRFLNRHTRWAQLRWNLNKLAYSGELLMNFPLWSLVFMMASGFTYGASVVAGLCWLLKMTGDALMNYTLNTGIGFRHCIASPFKDLIIGMTWPVPLLVNKIIWRGNKVRIRHNTLLVRAD